MTLPSIALVGPPGAGKSSAAPKLATRFGWGSKDLDDEFEQRYTPVVRFRESEEDDFYRKKESELLHDIVMNNQGQSVVLAVSSGTLCYPNKRRIINQNLLRTFGTSYLILPSVNFSTSVGILARRVQLDSEYLAKRPWMGKEPEKICKYFLDFVYKEMEGTQGISDVMLPTGNKDVDGLSGLVYSTHIQKHRGKLKAVDKD